MPELLLVAPSRGRPHFAASATAGVVSVARSLPGLEAGGRLGPRGRRRCGYPGGIVLAAVGAGIATGTLT